MLYFISIKQNTMDASDQPFYFIPASDPLVAQWKSVFEMFTNPNNHTVELTINPDIVDGMDVAYLQEMSFALQHYPEVLEKFVFAVRFKFTQIADSELYYPDIEWKTQTKYYEWFFRLSAQPHLLFLIEDHDARMYFLIGDWLANGEVMVEYDEQNESCIGLEVEQRREMGNRLFTCCRMFNLYCHGTGVDAQPYVDALIAEYSFDETNLPEMLRAQLKEDLSGKVKFRMVGKGRGEE